MRSPRGRGTGPTSRRCRCTRTNDEVGADESAPLREPGGPGEEYDYGRAKAAAEASVRAALGDRAAIVRPGLIVGPGDPTDRFGYWVGRFALAGERARARPDARGADRAGDRRRRPRRVHRRRGRGAVARRRERDRRLDRRSARCSRSRARPPATPAQVVEADDEWLTAHEVAHWAGPRSLPLWLPRDMPGFATRSNAAYRAAGGRLRDLRETLERTLADERERGLDREREVGLTRADELALLAELA